MANEKDNKRGKKPRTEEDLLPEDEEVVVSFAKNQKGKSDLELEGRVVVGKLITNRAQTRNGIRYHLKSLWEGYPEVQMAEIAPHIFAFTFQEAKHAVEVLEKRPWFVQNSLFSVQPWSPEIPHQEVRFDLSPFWVQIHGLPLSLFQEEAIRKISERMGNIIQIESPICAGRVIRVFARVKVEINIAKPIWSGSWISIDDGNRIWVNFKYERLQGLCFNCGVLGHEQRSCKIVRVMASYDKSKPKNGPFLSTSTPRTLSLLLNDDINSGVRAESVRSKHINCESDRQGENHLNDTEETQAERHDSNDVGREESGDNLQGYDLRSRSKNQQQYQGEDVEEENQSRGVDRVGVERVNVDRNLVGYVDMQDREEDPHQLVLYTMSADGTDLIPVDLVEVDTEADSWMEIGQEGLVKDKGESSGQNERVICSEATLKGLSQVQYGQVQRLNGNFYYITLPNEGEDQEKDQAHISLDKATEKELIWSWNDRLKLKRDRMLEAVEEELLRRKKQKREAWYDAEGRLLCVTHSDEFGTKTLVLDDKGHLCPNTN